MGTSTSTSLPARMKLYLLLFTALLSLATSKACDGTDHWCCRPWNRCSEGQGICLSDSDCEDGLICGSDNCQEFNPAAQHDEDCCVKKPTTTTMPPPTTIKPGTGAENGTSPYCAISPQHTMCKYSGISDSCKLVHRGLTQEQKQAMVDKHNQLRRKVAKGNEPNQPPAANMRKLVWNDELAEIAQRLADQCRSGRHEESRKLDGRRVGQNLNRLVQTGGNMDEMSEYFAKRVTIGGIQNMYDEVRHWNPRNINPFRGQEGPVIGHYTQIAWADYSEIGCGLTAYRKGGTLVADVACNFWIGGNFVLKPHGVPMYLEGEACSKCPAGTTCEDGLCA